MTYLPSQVQVAECQISKPAAGSWMWASTLGASGLEMSHSCASLRQATAARCKGMNTPMSWQPIVGPSPSSENGSASMAGGGTPAAACGGGRGGAAVEEFAGS